MHRIPRFVGAASVAAVSLFAQTGNEVVFAGTLATCLTACIAGVML